MKIAELSRVLLPAELEHRIWLDGDKDALAVAQLAEDRVEEMREDLEQAKRDMEYAQNERTSAEMLADELGIELKDARDRINTLEAECDQLDAELTAWRRLGGSLRMKGDLLVVHRTNPTVIELEELFGVILDIPV